MRSIVAATILIMTVLLTACGQSDHSDSASKTETAPPTDSLTVTLVATDSTNAFDLLDAAHDVQYRSSSLGVLVTGIDSIMSGDGHYWLYSVNGEMAGRAANEFVVRAGDTVVWHFRKPGN